MHDGGLASEVIEVGHGGLGDDVSKGSLLHLEYIC